MSPADDAPDATPEGPSLDDDTVLDRLLRREPKYGAGAYGFVHEALDFRVNQLPERRHISGPELLEGVRLFAYEKFGPMARTVLNHWGIETGEDVGRIVYLLIEVGVLSKTEDDRLEDFAGVIRFDEEFEKGYRWY